MEKQDGFKSASVHVSPTEQRLTQASIMGFQTVSYKGQICSNLLDGFEQLHITLSNLQDCEMTNLMTSDFDWGTLFLRTFL